MATNFPASLDTLTNPSATDTLDSPPHDEQHADANDAIEALQAKVGANSSAVTTSHDYKIAQLEGRDTAGLVLIDQTTVGSAVASVTMSSVFSATYDNYLVVINGVAGSVVAQLQLNYDGSTTAYYGATRAIDYTGSLSNVLANNAAHMYVGQVGTVIQQNSAIWIGGPFISERTSLHGTWIRGAVGGYMMGSHDVAASYTGFTIAPSAGTITGGTISTYGVAKS